MSAIAERVVLCGGCGKPIEGRIRVHADGNYHGATCRSRARRRQASGEALLAQADRAWRAVRAGADPYLALALLVWPPEAADRDPFGAA